MLLFNWWKRARADGYTTLVQGNKSQSEAGSPAEPEKTLPGPFEHKVDGYKAVVEAKTKARLQEAAQEQARLNKLIPDARAKMVGDMVARFADKDLDSLDSADVKENGYPRSSPRSSALVSLAQLPCSQTYEDTGCRVIDVIYASVDGVEGFEKQLSAAIAPFKSQVDYRNSKGVYEILAFI